MERYPSQSVSPWKMMADIYEIRYAGSTICSGSVPNLGYSRETLRDMERNGLSLYRNRKREKAASRGANTESGKAKYDNAIVASYGGKIND